MKKYLFLTLLSSGIVAVYFLYQRTVQSNKHDTMPISQADKKAILERALAIELLPVDAVVSEEANAFSEKATTSVHAGNYEEAIHITLAGLQKFPHNFTLQADLAALLGDCSEITPEPLKSKMIQKSKELFDKLLNEVDGQPKNEIYVFKNEYYYRFAMYREQYELGIVKVADYWGTKEWKTVGFKGYYSQGVGASNYAKQLLEQGNKTLALDYAQKSVVAWAQYFSYKNDYYNAYVHYALALGILGYKQEMMCALERSASLIKHDLDYHEFKEVIDFIEKI